MELLVVAHTWQIHIPCAYGSAASAAIAVPSLYV